MVSQTLFFQKYWTIWNYFVLPSKRSFIGLWRVHENLLFCDWGHQMSTQHIFLRLWSQLEWEGLLKKKGRWRGSLRKCRSWYWPSSELSSIYDRKSCWPSIFYLFFYLRASFVLVTMKDLRIETWNVKIPIPRKPDSILMKFGEGGGRHE